MPSRQDFSHGGEWSGHCFIGGASRDSASFFVDVRALRDAGGSTFGFLFLFDPKARDSNQKREERLNLLGGLASGIVHDLNNILTSVLGHVSFLKLALDDTGSNHDSLVTIEDGVKRAAAIANQVLDFARGSPAKQRPVNVSMVVASGINLLRGSLPKNVQLDVQEGMKDIYVFGDENQLSQIFMNIAVNAADALPRGGRIAIDLRSVSLQRDPDLLPGDYAQLTVRDNGIGMSQEIQSQIFEPFFTTKQRRGTGLGLANVFSLVRIHRGVIRVETVEGKGSTFQVMLPLYAVQREGLGAEALGAQSGKESILIVEDEEIVRTVLQRSLEHLGYEVDVATSGREAIEKYERRTKRFDLVILDMMMPQMGGDEVFLRLQKFNPEVRVLIASGYASDVRTRNVLERGGLGFIQKPFAMEELAKEVRRCLSAPLPEPVD